MGSGRDIYSAVNAWYNGYQHVTDMKDDVGWNTAGIGADGIGLVQSFGQQAGKALGATRVVEALETPIIEAGLLVMTGMSNLCGFGDPDQGQGFGLGSDAFTKVDHALAGTDSPQSWAGDASGAYSGQNGAQQDRARSVADADRQVQHVLQREAEQVQHTRDTIDHRSTVLTAAIVPAVAAMAIEIPPGLGMALSMSIQIAAVAATVPFAAARFEQLSSESSTNSGDIRRIAAAYDSAATAAAAARRSGDGHVTVASPDLQHVAGLQDQIAENVTQAGQSTHETNRNVFLSHGLVCSSTNSSVVDAIASRTSAASAMRSISTGLAGDLRDAAGQYDATDRAQQGTLDGRVR